MTAHLSPNEILLRIINKLENNKSSQKSMKVIKTQDRILFELLADVISIDE